jgi:hypothetical protein
MEGVELEEESEGFLIVPRNLTSSQDSTNVEVIDNIENVMPANTASTIEEWEKPEAPADEDPEEIPSHSSTIRPRRLIRMVVAEATDPENVRSMIWDTSQVALGDDKGIPMQGWVRTGEFWAFADEQSGKNMFLDAFCIFAYHQGQDSHARTCMHRGKHVWFCTKVITYRCLLGLFFLLIA